MGLSRVDRTGHRRTVLITGTSTGIGRACAVRLARDGFFVLAGVRREEDGRAIEAEANGASLGITSIRIDVADQDSVAAAAERIQGLCGDQGLCGVVNNAGICVVGPAECVPLAEWRRQFEVNLFGAIGVTQAMLPLLRAHVSKRGKGAARVVNISSVTGQVASPLFGAYSASKFALEAFSDALRMEVRGQGIHVCIVNPGTIQTEIWRKERAGVDAIRACGLAREVYGELIDNVSEFVFKAAKKSIGAQKVAEAVARCLVRGKPPIRVRVGWEAQVGFRARNILPERFFDYLMGKTMGVPGVGDNGNGDRGQGP